MWKWWNGWRDDKQRNHSLEYIKFPDEWKFWAMVKPPKIGNLFDCDHWRGMTFFIILRKMLCRVLTKSLQKQIDVKLGRGQLGIRPF